jgi:hypothetical protein
MSQPESANWFDEVFLHSLKLVGSIAIVAALLIASLIAAWWGNDVWQDRKHTVVVSGDTPLFEGYGENCGGTRIATLHPGSEPKVQRIRYWKACATINVILPDGKEGFIVLGDGDVRINPPLP